MDGEGRVERRGQRRGQRRGLREKGGEERPFNQILTMHA